MLVPAGAPGRGAPAWAEDPAHSERPAPSELSVLSGGPGLPNAAPACLGAEGEPDCADDSISFSIYLFSAY